MPRRKKKWSQVSAWTVVVLGLVAGVTMNLVTAWLQKDVIPNTFYFSLEQSFIPVGKPIHLNF